MSEWQDFPATEHTNCSQCEGRQQYGIVIYAGSLTAPAKFDCWYDSETLARECMDYWKQEYPNATVALVEARDIRFPKKVAA